MPEAISRELTFGAGGPRGAWRKKCGAIRACAFLGEDVAEAGTPFKVLSGLVEEFGTERVLDTPISEAGFTGIAVGAAMTGMRPVVDIMFGDFMTLTMDQMVNQAAKVHYMSGGKWKVPMVMRTTLGATRRSGAQHSQSLHAWFCHVPGLKVVMPSTPYDAKGLLKTAIRDENPVVFFEDKMMYTAEGPGAGGGVHDSARSGGCEARGPRHYARGHQQHGAGGAGRGEFAGEDRHQRGSDRSADDVAAGREDADRVGEEDIAGDCDRRRLWAVRGDGGDRVGDCRRRVLRLGRAGEADGRDACADSLFASAGRCNRADGEIGVRSGPQALRTVLTNCAES